MSINQSIIIYRISIELAIYQPIRPYIHPFDNLHASLSTLATVRGQNQGGIPRDISPVHRQNIPITSTIKDTPGNPGWVLDLIFFRSLLHLLLSGICLYDMDVTGFSHILHPH